MEKFLKHSHPLKENQKLWIDRWLQTLWICRIQIGEQQSNDFSASLPHGFHEIIQKRDKTMEVMKKGVTVKGKAIYDMEVLFAWLLVVGQQRGIDLKDVFDDHELSLFHHRWSMNIAA